MLLQHQAIEPAGARTCFWPSPAEARCRADDLFRDNRLLPVVLDMARGIAAVLVLLFHLRTWLLVPFSQSEIRTPMVVAFYAASTFGHDAVIIFFVLSGFLIGGAVLRIDFSRPASMTPYVAARLGRIGPVLIAAVVFSVLAETIMRSWHTAATCQVNPLQVIGNMLALSNLGMAPLCNNLPLWSLSNEIAYYIAFPLLIAIVRGARSRNVAAACVATGLIAIASLAFTPWDQQNVVLYFPVWLVGAGLWWVPARLVPIWPGVLAFAGALLFGRLEAAKDLFLLRDMLTASSFALVLAGLFGRDQPLQPRLRAINAIVTSSAAALASFSFSLYVVHNPVIGLYEAWAQDRGHPLPITALEGSAWGTMGGLFIASIAVAILFSLVFEHHHRVVTAAILRPLERQRSPAGG